MLCGPSKDLLAAAKGEYIVEDVEPLASARLGVFSGVCVPKSIDVQPEATFEEQRRDKSHPNGVL